MIKGRSIDLKCQNSEHDQNIKIVCLNEFCTDFRLFCMKCVQNKFHHAHLESWIDMPQLYELLSNQEQDCMKLLDDISKQFESSIQLFGQLKNGIKQKYILNKERLERMDVKQLNIVIGEMIQFQEYNVQVQNTINNFVKTMQKDLTKLIVKLKIQREWKWRQTLIQLGKKQSILNENQMLESTIKMLNQSQILNTENLAALFMKSQTLMIYSHNLKVKSLGQFAEAIIWADKALQIDQNHINSLYCKAKCLTFLIRLKQLIYMLDKYEQAEQWVDKVLKLDPNHVNALRCKGESLNRQLDFIYLIQQGKHQNALTWINKALEFEASDVNTIYSKAHCLILKQLESTIYLLAQYNEAILETKKALDKDPYHLNSLCCIIRSLQAK